VARETHIVDANPEVVGAAAKEEFAKVGDEEILMLCCDSWRLGGAMVGPCRLTLSKPVMKAPLVSVLEATI
jgi:hypothetical protein